MTMAWVTLDRLCEERMRSDSTYRRVLRARGKPLRSMGERLSDQELMAKLSDCGLTFDRLGLEGLFERELSAEGLAKRLMDGLPPESRPEGDQADWIWVCLITLWRRWRPNQVCQELLDDKIQAGYQQSQPAGIWLEAWADAMRLCDVIGIESIEAFDDRFPMTQSLYNWSQDLEDALWNAGLDDPRFLRARIAVCEEALRRFPHEHRLTVENRRAALAESYFEIGETERAEDLFRGWLADDPTWGWGWINWSDCHVGLRARNDQDRAGQARAEEILREAYQIPGVRDRKDIAERLQTLCEATGRPEEASELGRQAALMSRHQADWRVSSPATESSDHGDRTVVRPGATVTFDGEGAPLDDLAAAIEAGRDALTVPRRSRKVGRNEPCPCGSGRKFKRCCGAEAGPASPAVREPPSGHR